jgi:hypothetical protein
VFNPNVAAGWKRLSFSEHKTENAGRKKSEVGGSRLTDPNGTKGQSRLLWLVFSDEACSYYGIFVYVGEKYYLNVTPGNRSLLPLPPSQP